MKKKTLVSVSGSAPKLGFSSLSGRWRRRCVECAHVREECSKEGEEVLVCGALRIPSVCHVRLGKDSRRAWLSLYLKVQMWEQAHHALGQLREICTLPTIIHHTDACSHLSAERSHAAGGVGYCWGPWTRCGVRLAGGLLPGRGSPSPGSVTSCFLNHTDDQILPHCHHCEMECVIKLNLEIKKGLRNCYNHWPMHLL